MKNDKAKAEAQLDAKVNVIYQCDKCKESFNDINQFSAHLDFHDSQATMGYSAQERHEGGEYENLHVAQRRVVVINDGNGAQSMDDMDMHNLEQIRILK